MDPLVVSCHLLTHSNAPLIEMNMTKRLVPNHFFSPADVVKYRKSTVNHPNIELQVDFSET